MWGRVGRTGVGHAPAVVAVAVCLALLAVALIVVLSGSPTEVARANGALPEEPIMQARSGLGACQDGETLPAGTEAIRLTLVAILGPRVGVTVSSQGRRVVSGSVNSGWTAGAVTVPIARLARPVSRARVCFAIGRSVEGVEVGGARTPPPLAARTLTGSTLPGRFTAEYMRPAANSWWSHAKAVARRLGLGHAPAGAWLAVLLVLVMMTVVAGSSWLLGRELG